jgi:hypothetical protein
MNPSDLKHHTDGWLGGAIYCPEFAHSIAVNDEQKALAERLMQNAMEAQSGANADAATDAAQ